MAMRQGYQVFDTGEMQVDEDTGEAVTPTVQERKPQNYGDCETGEQTQLRVVYQRSKFRVPRSALKLPLCETAIQNSAKNTESIFNPTLLVLPILVILPGWASFLYIMAEVLYHHWMHKQGKRFISYNTPMTFMFHNKCAECVASKAMEKVAKLQDERTLRINSKRILNYDYAHFGIST